METKIIDRKIEISATPEKVWQVLWHKESYKKWAAAFSPGSYYTGTLQKGEKNQFLCPDKNGMQSEVTAYEPHKKSSLSAFI